MTFQEASHLLAQAGIEDASREARHLLALARGIELRCLIGTDVPPAAAARFATLVARRAAREPLAFIAGHAGFWTLDLEVGPATLIPRADSETLIEAARAHALDARLILDLGTGSGALLLAALSEFPRAFGVGVDRVAAAAALARRNARRNGLAERSAFLTGDWDTAIAGRFDIILINPPYIAESALAALQPEVRDHEPHTALAAGPDGLAAYRRLLPRLGALLTSRGIAVLEIGEGQGEDIARLVPPDLRLVEVRADLACIPRAVVLTPA
ncbi:MAG: peptide chain release factor N(5)-glutamine methyltransferase [Rhodospirillales bacterium]|nr:peptide chain release factor N(5)-glutamine methyltransferase [Rhodospirillales bacterium]